MAVERKTTPKKNLGKLGDWSPVFENLGRGLLGVSKYGGSVLSQGLTGIPSTTILGEIGKNYKGISPTTPSEQQTNDVVNPAEAAANAMADSMTTEDSGSFTGPAGGNASLPPFSLPTPTPFVDPTKGEMQSIITEIGSRPGPPPQNVPEPLSPLSTFLATFGASLASSMERNPAILENVQRRIADLEQRRQAIEEQNRMDAITFDQQTQGQIMSLRLSALQNQYQQAVAANDFANQQKSLEAITKLTEENKLRIAQIQEAGATARTRMTVGGKTDTAKFISMEDLQKRLGEIAAVDPGKLGELPKTWLGGVKNAMSKESLTFKALAGGALMGDSDEVKDFARGQLKESAGRLYGVDWSKPVNPRKIQQLGQALIDAGFDKSVAMTTLKQWLGGE